MNTGELHVVVNLVVKADRLDAALCLLGYHASCSSAEPGCVRFEILRLHGSPCRFTILETWLNTNALEHHRRTPHYARWRSEIRSMEATPRTHEEFETVFVGEPSVTEVASRIDREARRRGQCVVFTNGCFDVLHRGHVAMLKEARLQGGVLVIGLNSDASASRLKGPGRPVNPVDTRRAVLEALAVVDHVLVFDHDTPVDLIAALRPDVLVKGADYAESEVVGAEMVKSWGGRVHLAQFHEGHSTTALIRRLAAAI